MSVGIDVQGVVGADDTGCVVDRAGPVIDVGSHKGEIGCEPCVGVVDSWNDNPEEQGESGKDVDRGP